MHKRDDTFHLQRDGKQSMIWDVNTVEEQNSS